MTHQDPVDILETYYSTIAVVENDEMLRSILAVKGSRRQRVIAAVGSFSAVAAVAAVILAWAASPSKANHSDTSSAIARYQMINSGLVEAPRAKGELPR
jgi:hypothetical protein